MITTFKRAKFDPNNLYGVVVSESADLLLIHYVYDLQFDGYMAFRKKDVTESYYCDSNRYGMSLMRKEGLWERPSSFAKKADVSSWKTLLQGLHRQIVIVENERTGRFVIGQIVECGSTSVRVHHFDACGEWENIETIPYRQITAVKFGNRYSLINGKYLPNRTVTQ